MDPRFQPIVFNYLKKKKLSGKYSSFTIAGSAIGVTANKFKKWHKTFWDNFETSVKLHNIKKLIVMSMLSKKVLCHFLNLFAVTPIAAPAIVKELYFPINFFF